MKSIALTMIVKNEERCLARCLESIKPWVDDMIIVDTGSTDRTMDIAREFGARVFQRRWTNDFSAARNAAIAQSKADWNLILDADEWLVSGSEYFETLRHDRNQRVHMIRIDSDLGLQGSLINTSHYIPRIIPRGVRYLGEIHEQPRHRLPVVNSNLIVRHDGYLTHHMMSKRGRNLELLLKKVKEMPHEPYYQYQLAKEYDIDQDYEKALEYYRRAYAMQPKTCSWQHDMVLRMIECMKYAGQIEDAMIFASDEMPNWDHSPDFHLTVGELLLMQMNRRPEQGPALIPMMEECWLKALRIGDNPELGGTVRGQGSFIAAQRLWALYDARKDYAKAEQYDALYKQLYQDYRDSLEHTKDVQDSVGAEAASMSTDASQEVPSEATAN